MQEQQQPAISADSIKTGVTNDERFETAAADIHGYGQRHDPETCTEPACGHPDHGKSTSGENFKERVRAGEQYDGEGELIRAVTVGVTDDGTKITRFEPRSLGYNPAIAKGDTEAIQAIDHDPEACQIENCRLCNRVDEASLQPEYTISKGGGSSSKRKKKKGGGGPTEAYIMTSYPHPDKETEAQRAQRLARENELRIEQSGKPGPKLKGKEKRMHVQGTMEPSKVADLNDMTGKTCIEVLEGVHGVLSMVKSGAEGAVVIDALMGLLREDDQPEAA